MSYLNSSFGRTVKKAALGIAFSSLASVALAWSISGNVADEAGAPLAGVSINAMNIAGVGGQSDATGAFSISSDPSNAGTTALFGITENKVSVQKTGNILSIANMGGNTVKVTLLNTLGKVTLQDEYFAQNINIDMSKYGQQVMILRVSTMGSSENYVMTQKGLVRSLKLEAASSPLPLFSFALAGYDMAAYQMIAETETNVKIVMKMAAAVVSSSSAVLPENSSSSNVMPWNSSSSQVTPVNSSSSDVAISSSSTTPEVVSCTGKTLMTDQSNYSINKRKVIIQFPQGYDATKPAPLLINYHPIGGSADGWSTQSQIAQVAKADGAIVAFMDGVADHNMNMGFMSMSVQAWNVGPCCSDADDITFTKDFIKKISEEACVDTKRIYAAGFSMGGGMSNYVGCRMADVFAAAAPSAFDLAQEVVEGNGYEKCVPAREFPILNFRSTNDNTVPYMGGLSQVVENKPITFYGAHNTLEFWKTNNGCTGEATVSGGTVTGTTSDSGCKIYENCKNGTQAGLCVAKTDHSEGDATKAWNFLKQFKLP